MNLKNIPFCNSRSTLVNKIGKVFDNKLLVRNLKISLLLDGTEEFVVFVFVVHNSKGPAIPASPKISLGISCNRRLLGFCLRDHALDLAASNRFVLDPSITVSPISHEMDSRLLRLGHFLSNLLELRNYLLLCHRHRDRASIRFDANSSYAAQCLAIRSLTHLSQGETLGFRCHLVSPSQPTSFQQLAVSTLLIFLRAGRILTAQRQEILRALDRGGDFFQQLLQVFVAVDEVDLGGVHNQQVGLRVVKEKVFVGLYDLHQVILADGLLAGRVLFLQPLLQHFRRGLQIDDEVGRGQLFAKIIEVAIVGIEFLIVEVEAGEELVLFKNVIGHHGLIRPRPQIESAQLLEAANQKRQLGLEGGAGLAFVERFQKWIVFRLDNALGGQTLSQNPRQRALPNSYGTFNRDVTGKLEKLGHGLMTWRLSSGTRKQNIWLRLRTQLRERLTAE